MKTNITLILGDNANGKTRYLKNICNKYKDKYKIVTNLVDESLGDADYVIDITKEKHVEDIDDSFYETMHDTKGCSPYMLDAYKYIVYSGDILIIDDLDALLTGQEVIDICNLIKEMQEDWKEIYISGYSIYLLQLFYNDTDVNILGFNENNEVIKMLGDEAVEYIDTIRG